MPITLPTLPYARDALAPHVSGDTIDFHYGKHHQAYVTNLNRILDGKPEASKSLEEIIKATAEGPVFDNAAQIWNHTFYWNSMRPGGGGAPSGRLLDAMKRDFGSVEKMKELFAEAATTHFGSGWAWLVSDAGRLKITRTSNADLPLKHGQVALLTCDVWEHAYYIDYRNARPDYVTAYLDHLVNWEFAAGNFA